MKDIFNKIDKHKDLIISRTKFIKKLKENQVLKLNMDKPAVFIANLKKTLTLRIVLSSIEREVE